MRISTLNFNALLLLASACVTPVSAQQVIPLWDGKAPGSEDWTFTEKSEPQKDGGLRISDVTRPTLTVYLPERAKANGAAMIIAPGGAMRFLGAHDYATGPAKWLNDRGIAAFVLKYRVLPTAYHTNAPIPTITDHPRANANPFPDDERMTAVIGMAIQDAQQALRIVRSNAARWGVNPQRVGMLGYSAGGGVAMGAAVKAEAGAAPDFIISAYGPALTDVIVPANPPPIFLAVRQYHPNVAPAMVALYEEWTKARAPAELHIYDQVGGSPFLESAGDWLQRAHEWMGKRGFTR